MGRIEDLPKRCQPGEHDWTEDYYGQVCRICGDFMPNVEEDIDEVPEHGTCETCGGEWGDGWSNCTCEDGGAGYDYEYTPCTCRLCHCGNVTAHGGKCNDCLNGTHQG